MFTGIVERLGLVVEIEKTPSGIALWVDPAGWDYRPALGDSVAIDGCCLTVSAVVARASVPIAWRFDAIPQTLVMTTIGRLRPGDAVNLEAAATPTTLLGGHLVQGHVDGVAEIESIETRDQWRVRIRPPESLMSLICPQGSVTVAGVSLTVAAVIEQSFEVALIPTTLERTTLGSLRVGDRVNVETDALARTVERLLESRGLIARRT